MQPLDLGPHTLMQHGTTRGKKRKKTWVRIRWVPSAGQSHCKCSDGWGREAIWGGAQRAEGEETIVEGGRQLGKDGEKGGRREKTMVIWAF